MVYLPHWPVPASFGNAKIDYEKIFERMSSVLEKLDNPHKKLPPTIHIAGTNGKGSTANFLKEIFKQSGLKVDLYSSPHIHNCNERIIINNNQISDIYLYEILEEVRLACKNFTLTFFECLTISAFLAFSRSNSDILIVEAGMGARIDATNIIQEKIATIITPISYDHQEYLGEKIVNIAYEKAFIMRPKTDLILAPQPKEALQIIEIMARDQNVNLIKYDQDFSIQIDEETEKFDFKFKNIILENLEKPNLEGLHQYINSSVAIACALNLKNINISKSAIQKALKSVYWPSRIEKIENNFIKKFTKNSEIYIDGAHNVGGAFALRNWFIKKIKDDEKNNNQIKNIVIVGFSHNKCKENFLRQFCDICEEIIAVRVEGEPNPEESIRIFEIGKKANIKINPQSDLFDAFLYLLENYKQQKVRIMICGSLHLARDLKKFGNI